MFECLLTQPGLAKLNETYLHKLFCRLNEDTESIFCVHSFPHTHTHLLVLSVIHRSATQLASYITGMANYVYAACMAERKVYEQMLLSCVFISFFSFEVPLAFFMRYASTFCCQNVAELSFQVDESGGDTVINREPSSGCGCCTDNCDVYFADGWHPAFHVQGWDGEQGCSDGF